MKLLVCGATGYIGRRLVAAALPRFTAVLGTSSTGKPGTLALDLAQPRAFDQGRLDAGDVVLLTAAISAPDVCANDRPRALRVNVTGSIKSKPVAQHSIAPRHWASLTISGVISIPIMQYSIQMSRALLSRRWP